MKSSRQILIAILIAGASWQIAAAQPKKNLKIEVNTPPPPEDVLAGEGMQANAVVLDLVAVKPQMPLGPQDVLKSYEIAMNVLSERASSDFSVIVQAQQANQITREQAEYLLQQRYEMALMQYQVLSALHDVLQHDINEATQKANASVKTARSDTVVVVPLPDSVSRVR